MGKHRTKNTQDEDVPVVYSEELPDGSRRSTQLLDTDPSYLDNMPDTPTVYEAFLQGQRRSSDGLLLGRRKDRQPDAPYEWVSFSTVSDDSTAFGAGLMAECQVSFDNSTNVGIFAQNRVEWVVVDQACARYSMVLVPMYSTLGDEGLCHIVEQAELSVIVVDNAENLAKLTALGSSLSSIRYLILMDGDADEESSNKAKDLGWRVLSYQSVLESGQASPQELRPAKPDDVYTISYTSGTTGLPKGVVITHKAIVTSVVCIIQPFVLARKSMKLDSITQISYLPLAHLYERLALITTLLTGSKVAFFNGDITHLPDDIKAVKPTNFSAVPRVLYRIYDKIYATAGKSGLKRYLLDWAVESKIKALQRGTLRDDTIWDSLVFRKVRESFGGRLCHMNIGASATSPVVINFFRVALNISIFYGYAQTETGMITSSPAYDFSADNVGHPLAGVSVKLVDVPELGYLAKDGIGEICVRGPNVFREYYKMPEKTRETKDDEGWVHTGDVGTWTNQGNLKIVDRCKQIFKLSQGEYIAPEKVEGVYTRCSHVAQVYVDGLNDKDYLVGIVVPDFEVLKNTRKLTTIDEEALCRDDDVNKLILDEMASVGRENGLKGFEIVRRIHLHPTPFSMENGLLTVTMKSKRHELRKRFGDDINAMYMN